MVVIAPPKVNVPVAGLRAASPALLTGMSVNSPLSAAGRLQESENRLGNVRQLIIQLHGSGRLKEALL